MAQNYTVKLISKEVIAESTMFFQFEKPANFTYRAGQTVDVSLASSAGEGKLTHTFSLVTAPHEGSLAIATRMRDSMYKNTLKDLEPDSTVSIEGPYGSFFLHANENRPAVFLVGGIGITPFMSMIFDALHRELPHELYLFYSNRRPQDSAFLETLTKSAEAAPQFHFIPTMTDLEQVPADWNGERGYIDWEMIRKFISNTNPIYYMAGPEKMVTAMRSMLAERGVSEDDMRFEEFSGY